MSSKSTEPRSIASQLVWLFTGAAALLLCCGLGVLYAIVVQHAFEEDNAFLADKISALRSDLNRPDQSQSLIQELTRGGEHTAYWVRIANPSGRTLAETPGMRRLLPSNIFPAPGGGNSSLTRPTDYRIGDELFSLVATPEQADGERYIIQVAQDRSSDERFKKEFGALLVVVLAIGILAAALIALTVTRRGLRPLKEMTHSLMRTGPSHLNERVSLAGWPRELQPLATSFDEMLDRLEDSFTRLSQFSADLAHELRTPVANILGESQVCLTRVRTADEYRQVVESNVGECERLSEIIDNLLFLARAEAADTQTHQTAFDGCAAVEKIAAYYRTLAEDRHVAITCTGEGDIYADPILFGRAVSNLVDNALRFTSDGGAIRIQIAANATESKVEVTDNGCGISAPHLPRVFDRFYRVDSARSSHGVGLGLALVKSIADLHGGSAAVQSEVNRGTTVTLIFPNKSKKGSDGNSSAPL